jgi:hypothetical protein
MGTDAEPGTIANIAAVGGNARMDDTIRLQMIAEAVRYCQRVKEMGMPVAGYAKTPREAIYFAWTCRLGSKGKSAKYRSRAAAGRKWGGREIVYDHAIPYGYELKALMELTDVSPETVRPVLDKYDVCAIITADEDARLTAAGLQRNMPDDWDRLDPLARYKAVGIEIVENTNIPKQPLPSSLLT